MHQRTPPPRTETNAGVWWYKLKKYSIMTKDEYTHKLASLSERFEQEKQILKREYAFSNNLLQVGDVATDHVGSILIEKIQFTTDFTTRMPCCVYTGIELKKDGTPTKAGKKRSVHQSNVKNQ